MDSEARLLASVGAELGEGPVWSARDKALWFVDIKAPCVYRYDPASHALDRFDAPSHVGWILPAQDGLWVAGLAKGLHRFDPRDGSFTLMDGIEADLPDNRLNDAAVDPAGRIWFGSMDNREVHPTGHIYQWHRGAVSRTAVSPVVITNGPAISPDGRTAYLVDTLGLSIAAHPIGLDGTIGAGRPFLKFDASKGYPDGAICDAGGGVWVGFYGGWAARRFAPDGTMTHEVRFPVSNVTKIALGGDDGRTAFATTARQGLSAERLASQPLAGDIFTFRTDIGGIPVMPVSLDL
ncbi:SMP-30/gluconolactonase/LRE family protein [Sphingomonas aerolata]|uniref:SMP-30/gluconolactonase/LRE family protein n=1 Tax=Sphingomonas aerolata TaxID=185951 RepID=UPI002FE345CA